MDFGLDKCAKIHLKKEKVIGDLNDPELVDISVIRHLETRETCTYLGVLQSRIQDVKSVKESLRSRYKDFLRQIWSSNLSALNKVSVTNMLAVPVLLCSFGVV